MHFLILASENLLTKCKTLILSNYRNFHNLNKNTVKLRSK